MSILVANLQESIAWRCGIFLADAGRYLDDAAGSRAILEGLRIGVKVVGLPVADPFALADADLVVLSYDAVERVLDWGELHALRAVLLRWHLVLKTHGLEPFAAAADTRGGYLWEQKRAIEQRVRDLELAVAQPYVTPDSGTISVLARDAHCDPCWPLFPARCSS